MIKMNLSKKGTNRFISKRFFELWNSQGVRRSFESFYKFINKKIDQVYRRVDKGKLSDKILNSEIILNYIIENNPPNNKKIITIGLQNFEFLHIEIDYLEKIKIPNKEKAQLRAVNLWFIFDLTENFEEQEIEPTLKFYSFNYYFSIYKDLLEATNLFLKYKKELEKAFNKTFKEFLKEFKEKEERGMSFVYTIKKEEVIDNDKTLL